MPKYGLMIDYEFCVGCRVCELACKTEHNRPEGECGIHVKEVTPEISGGRQYFFPFTTDHCNLCGKRIARGLNPACVHNCWAGVMTFGRIEELTGYLLKKPRSLLLVPR
jgi:Fe-S-cluster-containing dehydrogenase component